jgi:hypothetical protein
LTGRERGQKSESKRSDSEPESESGAIARGVGAVCKLGSLE